MRLQFNLPVPTRGWVVQIHPIQVLKRFLFSRCVRCGKRFTWNDANGHVIGTWGSGGPKWFTNGEKIWHFRCHDQAATPAKPAKPAEAGPVKPEEASAPPVN